MPYTIKKVEVWAGDILNRPGMLARVFEALTNAGAQLEFMIARRLNEKTSRVFLAPVKGVKQHRAASSKGNRLDGDGRITRAVADRGINLRGASAACIGRKAVFYLAVDSEPNLKEAMRVVRKVLGK